MLIIIRTTSKFYFISIFFFGLPQIYDFTLISQAVNSFAFLQWKSLLLLSSSVSVLQLPLMINPRRLVGLRVALMDALNVLMIPLAAVRISPLMHWHTEVGAADTLACAPRYGLILKVESIRAGKIWGRLRVLSVPEMRW